MPQNKTEEERKRYNEKKLKYIKENAEKFRLINRISKAKPEYRQRELLRMRRNAEFRAETKRLMRLGDLICE